LHGGNFHSARDPSRPGIECAAEDEGKAQNVVNLVGIVGATVAITASLRTAFASSGRISGEAGLAATGPASSLKPFDRPAAFKSQRQTFFGSGLKN
jgi:hypothetical protein